MSEIALHTTTANRITCVPDYFIDNYMVGANGEYVKIYLYLLRCLGRANCAISISHIADALDHTQKDVRRALRYWANQGLLELEYNDYDELTCIYLKEPNPVISVPPMVFEAPAVSAPAPVFPATFSAPAPAFPATFSAPATDMELKEVLYLAEKLMGHTITSEQIDSIIAWHDTYGHSWNLIEYIIEYSVEKGKSNIKYMDKIALNWANEGIHTVDEAKSYNNAYLSLSFAVKMAFGITGRNLASAELEYINKWSGEYHFTNDIITEACRRTILKTHSASFEYADSILTNWYKQGVTSLDDLVLLDQTHAANNPTSQKSGTAAKPKIRFNNMDSRKNVNYSDLEKTLLHS